MENYQNITAQVDTVTLNEFIAYCAMYGEDPSKVVGELVKQWTKNFAVKNLWSNVLNEQTGYLLEQALSDIRTSPVRGWK